MVIPMLVIFLSSLAGALLALLLGWIWYRVHGKKQLDQQLIRIQEEFERHVKNGVLAAGEELLPAFRRNVADGFRDALRDLHPAGLAEDAAKVVSGAADLLGSGLGNLFGLKPRK
jgi:hypothetical protein